MKDLLTENRIIFFILVPFLDLSILIVFGDAAERVPSFSIQLYRNKRINQELLLLLRFQSLFFLLLVLCLIWSGTQVAIRGRFAKPLVGFFRARVRISPAPPVHSQIIYGFLAFVWRDRIAGRVHRSRKPEALRSPWVRIPLPPPQVKVQTQRNLKIHLPQNRTDWQTDSTAIKQLNVNI